MRINYKILSESVEFYEKCGFRYIETPWTVTKAVCEITKPKDAAHYEIVGKNKVLVGSGEQSFLYLYLKGFLPLGSYQTITPCFRDEIFDITHTKYFIKNEVIVTDDVSETRLQEVIDDSFNFFANYLDASHLKIVKTEQGFDIEYKDIEIGSYGIRECEYLKWIYGTGCAEPRFSNIINYNF